MYRAALCALCELCVRQSNRVAHIFISRRVRKERKTTPVRYPHETGYSVALCALCVR